MRETKYFHGPILYWTGKRCTYDADEDETDNEQATKNGLCIDVSVAHGGHSDHQEIQTFPVSQVVGIREVVKGIP